ncbi:hypothetical protein pb186bvf_000237 [Paramecium bursaria]
MSQSKQKSHKKVQKFEIDLTYEIYVKGSNSQIQQRINQDESKINNLYDLEQLNYRLFMNKEYERSLKLQQRLMTMVITNPEYYHQQALTYLALNDIDNAQKWYEDAMLISPCYDRYFFDYEIADYLPDRFSDQIKYIQNNIDYYKEQENQLIAECFFAYHVYVCQRPQKAVKMLMMLIVRYPKSYLPYFYASKYYHHKGNFYKGLEFINDAIMCFKYKDIQLYNLKGTFTQLLKKDQFQFNREIQMMLQEFIHCFQITNILKSKQVEIYFYNLEVQLKIEIEEKKRKEEQLKIKKKAPVKQPGKIEYDFQEKGIHYYKQRKYNESRECFLCAIEQNPKNGLCLFLLSKCCLKLGDFDGAVDHYNAASYAFDDEDRLLKLDNKIYNEKNRLFKPRQKGYQSRIIL